MYLNTNVRPDPSAESPEGSKRKSIYQRFNDLLGLGSPPGKEEMQACGEGSVADDTFATPVSSSGDLMAMSPQRHDADLLDDEHDLLTGPHFDNTCDITMQEATAADDSNIFDSMSIDYLVKCSDSTRNHTFIDRGKESLYVKFDPLYSRQKQESVIAAALSMASSTECDIGYETGSTASVNTDNPVVASPKRCVSVDSIALNGAKDKPTQRVRPAVKLEAPETTVSMTRSTPALVRSLSAIMTPSRVAIDKLISITGSTPPSQSPRHSRNSYNPHQMDHLQSLRLIIQKQDQDMALLRTENRELRCSLQDSEHNLTRTQEDFNAKIKKLTEERDNLAAREDQLLQQISEKLMSNKQMSIVMEEYEKTISSLIGDQQREKVKSLELQEQLFAERDEALKHLSNMETSFNDLLSKYEKCKSVIVETKDREKALLQKISEYEEGLAKYDSLYTNLKEVTSESLAKANESLENINKNHSHEIAKLHASIKKNELTMSSLQESLTQKTRENEELTKICDQLINSVR